jgi:aminopeptidase N
MVLLCHGLALTGLNASTRPIDIHSIELWLNAVDAFVASSDLQFAPVTGNAKLVIVPLERVQVIELDAVNLAPTLTSLLINGQAPNGQGVLRTTSNGMIQIFHGGWFEPSDTVLVELEFSINSRRVGMHVYPEWEYESFDAPHPFLFTFSQPSYARYWFPCNDYPHDKAQYTIHLTLPVGYTGACTGVMTDSTVTDSSVTTTWYLAEPTSSYLIAVNASRFVAYHQSSVSTYGKTIPIASYVWKEDLDGDRFSVETSFRRIPDMIPTLEKTFGEYPYNRYGHVVVAETPFGGMEHQMLSSISRDWLMGKQESGFAHEIAHHWAGNSVTCNTWNDLWLNEGVATWAEALWVLANADSAAYRRDMYEKRRIYMAESSTLPAIRGVREPLMFSRALTYNKAAWVFHMASMMAGGDNFSLQLQSFYRAKANQSISMEDIVQWLEESIPNVAVPWPRFFSQWVEAPGHPFVTFQLHPIVESPRGTVRKVSILQKNIIGGDSTVYWLPFTCRFYTQAGIIDTTFLVTSDSMEFASALFAQASYYEIDVPMALLHEHELIEVPATSVDTWPSTTQCCTSTVSVYALNGKLVTTVPSTFIAAASMSGVVPSGAYVVVCNDVQSSTAFTNHRQLVYVP